MNETINELIKKELEKKTFNLSKKQKTVRRCNV